MELKTSEFPITVAPQTAENFVDTYFADIDLGHEARNDCFRRIATQISRHPGGTLPDKLGTPANYEAMDRLMNRKETTHERIDRKSVG